jgi:hypothetical protein
MHNRKTLSPQPLISEEEIVTPVQVAPVSTISPGTVVTTSLSVMQHLTGSNNTTKSRVMVAVAIVAIIVFVELVPASEGVVKQIMNALSNTNNCSCI